MVLQEVYKGSDYSFSLIILGQCPNLVIDNIKEKYKKYKTMINLFYIIFFQFSLILFLLILIFYEIRVTYWGSIIIFSQILTLLLVIFNRTVGLGFNIYFFLYIVIIPAILPDILKIFSRNSKSNSKLKQLFFRLNNHLDSSFFNFFFINKGLLYLSEKFFAYLEENFRTFVKDPKAIIPIFILYPWMSFIIILIFEMIVYQKVYFAAVLLSINVLIYRFLLLFLRIIQYVTTYNLDFIMANANFEIQCQEKNYVFFFRAPILEYLIDNNARIDQEYLSKKWILLISGINFSSSYFFAYILKTYYCFYYRDILNKATVIIVFLGYILINLKNLPYLTTFLPYLVTFLFYLFCCFSYRTKFSLVDFLIKYQQFVISTIKNHLDLLIERNLLVENFRQIPLLTPTRFIKKPESFVDFFSSPETQDFFSEKLYFHQLVKRMVISLGGLIKKYW